MKKKRLLLVMSILLMFILIAGCGWKEAPTLADDEKRTTNVSEETDQQQEEAPDETELTETDDEQEEIPDQTEAPDSAANQQEQSDEPDESEENTASDEKDTCGCSFRWEPVCGRDGKTYINKCIYRCSGNSLDELQSNSQCPKKKSPVNIYTDDIDINYESDTWNKGYCWRQMARESGIRYCKNLVVNGRVNSAPEPAKGNWLSEDHLGQDRELREDSSSIMLTAGQTASNEEYDEEYQPLFETGKYRISFWARQDVSANNDWKVTLTLKDWWETKSVKPEIKGCYTLTTEINGNEQFIEETPNKWRHYHYEFDVPLNKEQWTDYQRESAECEYDWNLIPQGYGIEIIGPSFGEAFFDDFVIEKMRAT